MESPSAFRRQASDSSDTNAWKYTSYGGFHSPIPITQTSKIPSSLGVSNIALIPSPEEVTFTSNYTRSYSYDDWEEYIYQCEVLDDRLTEEKLSVDKSCEFFIQSITSMKELSDNENYIKNLEDIETLAKEIVQLTAKELKEGKSKKYVKEMQKILQSWEKGWPVKRVVTKLLLAISRISRIVQFLVSFIFSLLKRTIID